MKFEEALEEYRKYLNREYRKIRTREAYYRSTMKALKWIHQNRNKNDTNELTPEEIGEYKAYCMEKYKQNGNVIRLNSINNFTCKFLKKEELRVSVPRPEPVNKPVMSEKELEKYIDSTINPLEYLIAILQIDGLLRPTEICAIKMSNIDFKNQKLYLDDTKTGNNYIIMSPRVIKAIEKYLLYRYKPKKKEHEDRLIIIPKGSCTGLAPDTKRGRLVYNATKRIASRAGFKRSIYPYLIKPSAITNDFDKRINPKIIQRKARHKRVETTLRYDHTSDDMVKKHFHEIHKIDDIESLGPEDKARAMLDRFLAGEIDKETFKSSIDILMPSNRKDDIAYG